MFALLFITCDENTELMKYMYMSTKTATLLNHGPEWAEVLALLLFLLLSSSDSRTV